MPRKKARKKAVEQDNKLTSLVPILTVAALLILSVIFFRHMQSATGYVIKESPEKVFCVKEGRDGLNHPLYGKNECCFLIANTDRCTEAMEGAYADYFVAGELEGTLRFHHACYGGSSGKVLVGNDVIRSCGFNI